MTDDEQAIREVIETWQQATAAGDSEKVLSLMTDDVVFLVAGRGPSGKQEFAAALEQMKRLKIQGKSEVVELEVTGDWAWCRTHLAVTVVPPNGKAVYRAGYSLGIFKRQASGAWLLARDANLLTTLTSQES